MAVSGPGLMGMENWMEMLVKFLVGLLLGLTTVLLCVGETQ
jgi:hypothetical protein